MVEAGPSTPGRARNVGIEAAQSDWVAMTDAGVVLDPHWLSRLVRFVESDPSVDVVYGSYVAGPGILVHRLRGARRMSPRRQTPPWAPYRANFIASCLLRRSLWARAGRIPDLRAAEDRIFMRRLDTLGARVAASAEAVAWWQLQPTLGSTYRRFHTYSRVNAFGR